MTAQFLDPERKRQPEPEPPEPETKARAPLSRQAVLDLQRGHGNAWVARKLALLMRQGDPAREAFLSSGPMPSAAGIDMTSATGIGGFNALYDPALQELLIRLRVGINAADGLTIDPTTGVVTPGHPRFAASAARVMAIPNVADRVTEVNTNWHWTDAEGFRARYESMAEKAWGGRHYFINDTWDDVFADVNVDLDVHLGGLANDHCTATIFKVPEHSARRSRRRRELHGQPDGQHRHVHLLRAGGDDRLPQLPAGLPRERDERGRRPPGAGSRATATPARRS